MKGLITDSIALLLEIKIYKKSNNSFEIMSLNYCFNYKLLLFFYFRKCTYNRKVWLSVNLSEYFP